MQRGPALPGQGYLRLLPDERNTPIVTNFATKRFSVSSMVIMALTERESFEFLSVAFRPLQASDNAA
jgi:hypothetical protein